MNKRCLPVLMVAVVIAMGCQEQGQTTTRGSISVVVGESVFPLVQKEAAEFMRLYEQSHIELTPSTSREAIIQFLTGKVATIIVSRDLNEEEKKAVEAYKLSMRSWPFAMDAVVIIVNPENPAEGVTMGEAGQIFSGKIANWKNLGGNSRAIEPFVLSRNTGTAEFFLNAVVHDTMFATTAKRCSSSTHIVDLVASRRGAIGFVGLAWVNEKVKALKVAADSATEYIAPNQALIYQGEYPLRRTIRIMSTDTGYAGLSTGFITFLTSAQGQKIVTHFGLVPVTMPVRIVRIE